MGHCKNTEDQALSPADVGAFRDIDHAYNLYSLKAAKVSCLCSRSSLNAYQGLIRPLSDLSTAGADFIDYILTDKIITPEEHSSYYSEKFVYLPHCYQVNDCTQAVSNKL